MMGRMVSEQQRDWDLWHMTSLDSIATSHVYLLAVCFDSVPHYYPEGALPAPQHQMRFNIYNYRTFPTDDTWTLWRSGGKGRPHTPDHLLAPVL